MEPNFVRNGSKITLGWLDGRMQNRAVARFSPHLSMLAACDHPGEPEPIAVELLAYVAFLKLPGSPPPPPSADRQTFRVHSAGGKRFLVAPIPPEPNNPLDGLYAHALDENSPFAGFFFYTHGINALENSAQLGALLVEEGHVAPADLQRGIQAQNPPIGQILVEMETVSPESVEAAISVQDRKRLRLGEVLIEAGLATARDIDKALAEQKKRRGRKIGEILIDLGIISESTLTATLAKKFNIPFVDLTALKISPEASASVPKDLVLRYGFLPVAVDMTSIVIAISDPLNTEITDVLRFNVPHKTIREVLATPSQLKTFVAAFLDKSEGVAGAGKVDQILKELIAGDLKIADVEPKGGTELGDSDSSIIKLANQIIIDAHRRGASDIHIEPKGAERNTMVRFRVDGECMIYQEVPSSYRAPLVARIKIMANLDISERRKPQDGKIRLKLGDRELELRVATIPTVNGNEDVVMRILAASKPLPIDQIGLSERNLRELRRLAAKPYGLLLCVGPTGSGKTTTLHSLLGSINTPDMKIWTAEDPVEITQDGLRQVQVHAKVGFTFAAAMRAFLRADPDVIMVGEMRDEETASTAVEASLTGHLVLSTLHTNSAPETVTRLLDMGIDPFSFADALLGTLAQRLARRLCTGCRVTYRPERTEFTDLATAYGGAELLASQLGIRYGSELRFWRAPGCDRCGKSGYSGRIGLHELLVADDELKQTIQQKSTVTELRRLAIKGGMTTLLQDGIAKALDGLTDLRQVLAVCSR